MKVIRYAVVAVAVAFIGLGVWALGPGHSTSGACPL